MANSRIIIPLDGKTEEQALDLVDKFKDHVWGFKVNDLLLDCGVDIIRELVQYGNVMADPKLYDIPNTVANAAKKIGNAGANLCTVHASGGLAMMKAAVEKGGDTGILAVTILTSFDEENAHLIYGAPIKAKVLQMARMAKMAGASGIVCSPKELAFLKGQPGTEGLIKVVPGIRPHWHQKDDDQKRKATPAEATKDGASFLVIGRPITGADDPVEAAERTNEEVNKALEELKED